MVRYFYANGHFTGNVMSDRYDVISHRPKGTTVPHTHNHGSYSVKDFPDCHHDIGSKSSTSSTNGRSSTNKASHTLNRFLETEKQKFGFN
ncbi:hypothetical protein HDE_14214 [Halotydeus destructor]|nr:hypothetical protein HDE_14214 [Halotydeus destructor]